MKKNLGEGIRGFVRKLEKIVEPVLLRSMNIMGIFRQVAKRG